MAAINTRVVLDLVRDAQPNASSIVDLTPYFQGRVGDSQAPMPLALKMDGRPQDMTGYGFQIEATDSAGHTFVLSNCAKEVAQSDSFKRGFFTVIWAAEMFQNPGIMTGAFVITNPDTNERISTLDFNLNVLGQAVSFNTLNDSYSNRLEDVINDLKSKADEMINGTSIATLTAQLKSAQSALETATSLINTKGIPTTVDMQNYVKSYMVAQNTGDDLNTLTTPGMSYYVTTTSAGNLPNGKLGLLSIHGNTSHLLQVFTDADQNAFVRGYENNVWSNWRQVTFWPKEA
ncbi:BppU family phage baseplate upper protein [Limosilactobacillus mucosae]|uniref:BppU family phage baseplate upper protein n=1 Tax=Limosilactobacillus mucosae TaxID=97478 RepID=UPI0015D5404C|nr:BppU family phage baseplate upper protein [Limosilactobacillus mucosae]QLI94575.1 BppU family phage baseplate upper protein [Limosilactobacillus mucosae]